MEHFVDPVDDGTDHRKALEAHRTNCRYPKRDGIRCIGGPATAWLADFSSVPGFKICLSHHPEYFPLIPPSVNLVLSGHAHGGQWAYYSIFRKRMCGIWCPGQGFLPRWTKGVYEEKRLVVSAGLANTASVPRLFNPTEVVFIDPTFN